MNFYKHHIGDYASATEHLTWDEDQAYTRLLRVYYRDERPLPLDIIKVVRLARAQSPTQKAAVETVLNEFFSKESDGWHNKRCDAEIAQATTQADTNRRIAAEREAARLARIANQSSNGSSNGSSTNRSPEYMGGREPIQTPDSNSQTPLAKEESEKDEDPLRGLRVNGKHPKPKPKSPLPPDFELTDAMQQQAITKFSDCDTQAMFEQFKAYHEREGSAYKSWPAAWTTWIGNAEKFGYPKRRTTERKWD